MKKVLLYIAIFILCSFIALGAPGDPTCFINATGGKTACVGGNYGIGNFTGNITGNYFCIGGVCKNTWPTGTFVYSDYIDQDLNTTNQVEFLQVTTPEIIGTTPDSQHGSIYGITVDNAAIDYSYISSPPWANPGACPEGYAVVNTTTSGVECGLVASTWNYSEYFDQNLNTTSDVQFGDVTVGNGTEYMTIYTDGVYVYLNTTYNSTLNNDMCYGANCVSAISGKAVLTGNNQFTGNNTFFGSIIIYNATQTNYNTTILLTNTSGVNTIILNASGTSTFVNLFATNMNATTYNGITKPMVKSWDASCNDGNFLIAIDENFSYCATPTIAQNFNMSGNLYFSGTAFQIIDSSDPIMTFTQTDRVGILTASPVSALDVNGTITATTFDGNIPKQHVTNWDTACTNGNFISAIDENYTYCNTPTLANDYNVTGILTALTANIGNLTVTGNTIVNTLNTTGDVTIGNGTEYLQIYSDGAYVYYNSTYNSSLNNDMCYGANCLGAMTGKAVLAGNNNFLGNNSFFGNIIIYNATQTNYNTTLTVTNTAGVTTILLNGSGTSIFNNTLFAATMNATTYLGITKPMVASWDAGCNDGNFLVAIDQNFSYCATPTIATSGFNVTGDLRTVGNEYMTGNEFITGNLNVSGAVNATSFNGITKQMVKNWDTACTAGNFISAIDENYTYCNTPTNAQSFSVANNLTINGEVVLNNTVWDDLRFPASAINPAGAASPMTYDVTNLGFTAANGAGDTYIAVIGQMPHSWKMGSNIHPHIHWLPSNTNIGVVNFTIEYKWTNIGEVESSTWTTLSMLVPGNGTANMSMLSEWDSGGMNGTGKTLSSTISMKISRRETSASDNFTGNVLIKEFDIHYEMDSLGSASELGKWS